MVNPLGHWLWVLFCTRSQILLGGLSRFQGIGLWIPLRQLSGFRVSLLLVVLAVKFKTDSIISLSIYIHVEIPKDYKYKYYHSKHNEKLGCMTSSKIWI